MSGEDTAVQKLIVSIKASDCSLRVLNGSLFRWELVYSVPIEVDGLSESAMVNPTSRKYDQVPPET